MNIFTNRLDWGVNIIAFGCIIVFITSPICGYSQIQPDQIGFAPDSSQIWILGIDTAQSSQTYGQGKWYSIDSLPFTGGPGESGNCTITTAIQVIMEQYDVSVLDELEAHINIPDPFDG